MALADPHRFAILESGQDTEFQFEGRAPSRRWRPQDPAGVVVHVGTLSKIFSPSLRLGFVHGPLPLVKRMTACVWPLDRQGDMVLERALAELMEDGEIQRHLNRMHQIYRRRRDALCVSLQPYGSVIACVPAPHPADWPCGSGRPRTSTWTPGPPGPSSRAWPSSPGRQFAFDAGAPCRACAWASANYSEPELEEVAHRMAAALEVTAMSLACCPPWMAACPEGCPGRGGMGQVDRAWDAGPGAGLWP